MQNLPIYIAIAGFLAMGMGAMLKPVMVTKPFGIPDLSAAGRNEVRAVYGGFGLMMAVALGVALRQPDIREGILLVVAAALAGMAAGRVASALMDRRFDAWPLRYCVLQTVYAQLKQSFRHASTREKLVSARFNRIDLARIALPDTGTVMEALDLLHRTTPDWVCRHTLRTWSWAMIFSQIDDLKPDHETLAISCLLHDLALTQTDKQPVAQGCTCFAIEGGNRAGRFLSSQQWDQTRIRLVEEAICLHMTPVVTLREGVEAHFLHEAAALDVSHGCRHATTCQRLPLRSDGCSLATRIRSGHSTFRVGLKPTTSMAITLAQPPLH